MRRPSLRIRSTSTRTISPRRTRVSRSLDSERSPSGTSARRCPRRRPRPRSTRTGPRTPRSRCGPSVGIQHGDSHRRARDQRVEVGVLARQFLSGSLQQGRRSDALGKRAVGTSMHAVHAPGEHRDQNDGEEMWPRVALQQDADGQGQQDSRQEVAKAARSPTRVPVAPATIRPAPRG